MRFSVVHDNPEFENRIQYVFDFIANHPLAGGKAFFAFQKEGPDFQTLKYVNNTDKDSFDFCIPAQKTVFSGTLSLASLFANKYSFEGFTLFSVENKPAKNIQPFYANKRFGLDLVETIFFHISRLEEHICKETQKDIHGRMLPTEQFLVRNDAYKTPVVDYLIYCFLKALGLEPPLLPTIKRLSFDVDILEKYSGFPPFRSTAKYLFRKPNLQSLLKLWKNYFDVKSGRAKDPYNTFNWMFQKESCYAQVVYFLVGGTSIHDKPYPVLNEKFRYVVNLAKEKGLTIGIHPSYNSHDSMEIMGKEKEQLENMLVENVRVSRQHFLHFTFETTPCLLEQLGINEDSTLGFSDRIGFRCGTGFAYFPYCFQEERPYHFKEMPMVVMDVALFREAGNKDEIAKELWDDFLHENRFLTHITFNFHNSRFFDAALDGINMELLFKQLK